MSRFTDFIWPTLEKPTPSELAEDDASEAADIAAARTEGWALSPELAMDEARRLADSEEDRRRTTESKASTYLLFAAAFAAALIPFLPTILDGKTGSAPRWLVAIILIGAVLYLMGAGFWAFRTLRVGTYHRLDAAELTQIWRRRNPVRALVRETVATARMNYRAVNEKVSCIKMAHEFLLRSFIVFGILVVVEAGWETVHSAITTHEGQIATGAKAVPMPTEGSALGPVSNAPNHPSASVPSSPNAKTPSGDTATGVAKSGTNTSTQPVGRGAVTSPATTSTTVPSVINPSGAASSKP